MTFRRLAVWLVVFGLLAPVAGRAALAQEEDDLGVIYGFQAEALFPATVRFYVAVSVPVEEIAGASLTLRLESGWERSVTVDPERNLMSGSDRASELVYSWSLAGDDAPPLFETLVYAWHVETVDGQSSDSEGELTLVDAARGEWKSAGEAPLVLYWSNEDLGGGLIRDDMLAAYDLLGRHTGEAPDVAFAIYDPDDPLCQEMPDPETGDMIPVVVSGRDGVAFPCSREAFEAVYAQAGIAFVQRPSFGYADLRDLLIRRMVAGAYRSAWSGAAVPDWFASGLAQLYQQRPGGAALALVRSASRTEALLPLPDLQTRPPDDAPYQERALWDAESYLLALYLADRFGAAAPFELAAGIGPQRFAAALAGQTGLDEAALWNAFTRWLFLEEADRAVLWTPYLSTTPTPTPTATYTSPPPTATVTPTPTITPTPTSTYLADQARTAVVMTLPPTSSRRATNTPLPPGSLPTATRPVPVAGDASDEDGRIDPAPVMGIAAAVVAGIGLALLALSRRRRR